jgi:hypothetical protein
VVTPSPPSRLISAKSAVYFRLVTAYGGSARNCELSFSTNGVTSPHPGANTNVKPGVKRYSPGAVPCGNAVSNNGVSAPSPVRTARIVAAAARPSWTPWSLAGPFAIAPSAAA